jgi:hypothetical protein
MTYDSWKTTNPGDEWLGSPPCAGEVFGPSRCPICGCGISADETPCEGLGYGYTCGIALLREGSPNVPIRNVCRMTAPKIITRYDPKPIPVRQFDWLATTEDYDLGSPIGYGRTEAEAINDLKLQLDGVTR